MSAAQWHELMSPHIKVACNLLHLQRDSRRVACFNVLNGSPAIQEHNGAADVENGRTIFHDSGSSLTHHRSPDLPSATDPAGANCWDIDAADIVICKHPDGTHWLLNVSESGKVCPDKRCYQDSVLTSAAAVWLDDTQHVKVGHSTLYTFDKVNQHQSVLNQYV